jgi:hypothetical protein
MVALVPLAARLQGVSAQAQMARVLADVQRQHAARSALLGKIPELRGLRETALRVHVGPNAMKNKAEAFADARTQLYDAGADAGAGTTAISRLGRSFAAIAADAEAFRSRLAFLRVSLDPWNGLATEDLLSRRDQVLREGTSMTAVMSRVLSQQRAGLPLEPPEPGPDGSSPNTEPSPALAALIGAQLVSLARSAVTSLLSPEKSHAAGAAASSVAAGARIAAGLGPVPRSQPRAVPKPAASRKPDPARLTARRVAHAAAVARRAGAQRDLPVPPRYLAQASGLGVTARPAASRPDGARVSTNATTVGAPAAFRASARVSRGLGPGR